MNFNEFICIKKIKLEDIILKVGEVVTGVKSEKYFYIFLHNGWWIISRDLFIRK